MGYDTSEKNREYFDSYDAWCDEVVDAGGSVREGRGLLIAEGWYGMIGEYDVAAGEGWMVASYK